MQTNTSSSSELFQLNGKPTFGQAFPQAMQHVLAMLVGNITPPMLIASTLSLSAADQIMLTQAAMLIGGITTLLQLFPVLGFGMGLPSVMGVAFAYMPILTMIGTQYGIAAIFGSQLVAGFVSIFIGMFMGKIRRFFPPIVSGTVVLSIGLSLYETAITYMGGGSATQSAGTFGSPQFWILAVVTLVVTLACSLFGKGYLKVSGMLIGIVVGYVIALFMGDIVDFSTFNDAGLISVPIPFHFGLEFHADAIIMMILMYVVQAVQTIGDVSSTAMGGFGREATDKELGGAIKGQSICGMIGAIIGGLPTDPYSQNVGLICTTKVVAKRVFLIVGVIMLAAGFCPKFGALMTTIPQPVLGGATVTVFAAITMSGIQLLGEQPMNYRNKLIVGIALAIGVGIDAVPDVLQFCPQLAKNILGSSLMVSFLIVFILNIIVPEDNSPAD
ncbi:MAG TPA: purine permease [Candidatus Anaerobutyricum stercoris]|uniref:Purine permease n=1 Tax=Candidatus Anaerobutyricum stercoris TaxID=2838457 RepID=A0A9D2J6V8_9FIRM|nr:nucleobase:cation symporter-2 family protein [Eubacterium sp. An3]OUO25666.1 uracil permease [Eubacterium sp. An3]CVI71205.1 Xanthine permease XanP [Eubacteriaceae bacterium CHKCI004]HIZ39260.1 purine permease [Candidatus Anaerobutyricum stercoris]